jgi:multicomponent Na+:H+ antiporter subunit F
MAALSSISAKVALIILVVAVLRGDWMIGLVGAIALSAGNAGILLLANLLREVER